ncbi:MAG: SRPBCC family protein [Alcanivorax jadensis]|uniref:SRPBCC family protein n=1 Tax=Alcanivorax jadensis TaxID=64988 RepID=UPI003001BD3B|tara:strand:+ start:163 stop:693 length:531 start_codon:yes stop_codon:yes gene_type:complete
MESDVQFTNATTLTVERTLPGPIERVWAYLTEPDKRARWLGDGTLGQFVGGAVEIHFHNRDLSEDKQPAPQQYKHIENQATLSGTITRFEPPHVLAHTWGDNEGEVTFELTERGDQVHLLLTHRQLPEDMGTRTSVASGWHTHLGILVEDLNGLARSAFWPRHTTLEAHYRKRLAG